MGPCMSYSGRIVVVQVTAAELHLSRRKLAEQIQQNEEVIGGCTEGGSDLDSNMSPPDRDPNPSLSLA